MHTLNSKTFVVSLGGSIIIPKEGFDIDFLREFTLFIKNRIAKGYQFYIVCGGGTTCRQYQRAAIEIDPSLHQNDIDWIGIHTTIYNAHFIHALFKDLPYPKIISDYDQIDPQVTDYPLIIGAGWKPGYSSDMESVLLADKLKVKTVINLSNIDMVYDQDPHEFPDARPIPTMSWDEFISIIGTDWKPGLNTPFDPIAAQKAKDLCLKVIICNGKNLPNLENILAGKEFTGTVVE
ncbi:UMP kinase [Patescibacteria group bacterium]|nr:UMP kinase [Patescibacteria group bacterium]MBU1868266.1 UMP kinase [Patescibacteria group bacterium]